MYFKVLRKVAIYQFIENGGRDSRFPILITNPDDVASLNLVERPELIAEAAATTDGDLALGRTRLGPKASAT